MKGREENEGKLTSRTLTFVYPFGSTLNVNRLSTAVLSSGSASFPIARPVAAFHEFAVWFYVCNYSIQRNLMIEIDAILIVVLLQESTGRLVVCGSVHMFSDAYIDKEENSKIFVRLKKKL